MAITSRTALFALLLTLLTACSLPNAESTEDKESKTDKDLKTAVTFVPAEELKHKDFIKIMECGIKKQTSSTIANTLQGELRPYSQASDEEAFKKKMETGGDKTYEAYKIAVELGCTATDK